MNHPLKVINLFGGPGCGKSTTAAGLFHAMKTRGGLNVELVTEYAKDMTWESRYNILADQLYILAKQHRRQLRVVGQVDYIITDSPLLLSLIYTPPDYPNSFRDLVLDLWNNYDNYNYVLNRTKTYVGVGRSQTEGEARKLDLDIRHLLAKHDIFSLEIDGDETAVHSIMYYLGLN